jgi:hypothetical protein
MFKDRILAICKVRQCEVEAIADLIGVGHEVMTSAMHGCAPDQAMIIEECKTDPVMKNYITLLSEPDLDSEVDYELLSLAGHLGEQGRYDEVEDIFNDVISMPDPH